MAEEAKAGGQYGDVRGSISLDGWDRLAAIDVHPPFRNGYWPIGLEIHGFAQGRGHLPRCRITILAVDEAILEARGADGVARYARSHDQIPVFRFECDADVAALLPLIKRLSITLQDKVTNGIPLMVQEND